ncbi:MAG: polysaccharide biosynthesis tyrosine autokinase [Rubrivivax sp.]|nr:polysaccharide biosynthesis tyrosine autokinase [Rubrivivax sp.]
MARFRDDDEKSPEVVEALHEAVDAGSVAAGDRASGSIGDFLAVLRDLKPEQVERILAYQRDKGVRFGEAAVALGLASRDDVLAALSQQFDYPVATGETQRLGSELITLTDPFGTRAEHFRSLRSQLMMRVFAGAGPHPALAVISPDVADGRSFCVANLAVVLAQLGGRTLLVDADLRGPRQHEIFQLDNRSGLSSILSGRSDQGAIQPIAAVPSLFVLTAGTTPPNPLELVERASFGLLMRELTAKFDHVVIDTPAAAHGADASVIAARSGAALIVARKDKSRFATLQELVASFAGTPAQLAGVVYNEA